MADRRSYDLELQAIGSRLDNGNERMERIETTLNAIASSMNGNGKPGILTRLAVTEVNVVRLWWWVGGLSLSIAGCAAFVIRAGIIG